MLSRIASALVLAPAVLALVIFAKPLYLLAFLGLVGTLCLREYFHLMEKMALSGQPCLGYAGFWILLTGLHWKYLPWEVLLAGILISCFLAAMWRENPMRDRVAGMMVNLLGILYLGLFLYLALPLRYEFGEKLGLHWILILLAVIWTGDVAALLIGKSVGRTLFSPEISPNKTNEGAVAGLVAGVAAAAALQHFLFNELPLAHVAIVALLIGMVGQLGDLAESMLKRAADAKDSSDLIPGHGGVLDRVDSLLFAIPVLYFYLLRLYS